ncbi:unnamed protein product [Protopolystoma xenopodis]|uniref:Uncharacterized protein n=1 Tax=Protopolystoma xenopodis TaxID=117903 RepID=A0A3S5AUV8_9PLAT|nr:unnamed protein product [Protopolystoma xenopodis]
MASSQKLVVYASPALRCVQTAYALLVGLEMVGFCAQTRRESSFDESFYLLLSWLCVL